MPCVKLLGQPAGQLAEETLPVGRPDVHRYARDHLARVCVHDTQLACDAAAIHRELARRAGYSATARASAAAHSPASASVFPSDRSGSWRAPGSGSERWRVGRERTSHGLVRLRTPAREWFGRLALVGGGLVLGVLTLEMCLQVAAWWNVPGRRDAPAHPIPNAGRVVCLGDSNTYGLYVGSEEAYPSLLQKLLNDGSERAGVEVVNLGYPGNNSSAVRNRLDHALEVHRPDIVTIMIGANDLWTVPEPVPGEPAGTSYFRLWKVSRVYRLVSLLWQALRGPSSADRTVPDAPYVAVAREGGSLGWSYALQRNLEDMAVRIRRAGTLPILLTYPSDRAAYGDANRVIRSTAASAGIRLIDLTATFRNRCPGGTCPELFPDQHPTAAGHALVARAIAASVAPPPRPPLDW